MDSSLWKQNTKGLSLLLVKMPFSNKDPLVGNFSRSSLHPNIDIFDGTLFFHNFFKEVTIPSSKQSKAKRDCSPSYADLTEKVLVEDINHLRVGHFYHKKVVPDPAYY
jgi:hypothetical protein